MSQVEKLTIFFVLQSDNASEADSSFDMKSAYNAVINYGGNAEWIKPSLCLNLPASAKDVFVFEKFEGDIFEELKKQSAKILGARCMLTCITSGRSIPSSPSPIFCEGMRDLIICCTGFELPAKKNIQEKVEYMAGIFVKSLRALTTHLVAYNNISTKAIQAYKSNLKIMKYEWIEAVWQKSQHSNICGNDEMFNSYISPLFHNLIITTTGIAKKEKDKLKELIESNGGNFSGIMQEKTTNILIASKPEGEKYKFAKTWNIVCVKPSWVYDCISSKAIQPLNLYSLDTKSLKSSTPNKEDGNYTANFSMVSAIAQESDKMISHLEETNTLSFDSGKSNFVTPKKLFSVDDTCDIINNIIMNSAKDAGLFLDGCNIYLCGFNTEENEKLKKVLNFGGATRFNEPNDFVTHVIMGKKTDKLMTSLKNVSAHIVSLSWLVESIKLKRPAPVYDFIIADNGTKNPEPPSPLSKLGAKLLTSVDKKKIPNPQFCLDKESEKNSEIDEDLLNKYKQSQPGEPLTPRENPLTRSTNSSINSKTNSTMSGSEFFKGLTFFLSSELMESERKELEGILTMKGGTVVTKRFLGVPDYAIVPICGASLTEMTTKEIVNVFFVKDCCFEDTIVPFQYYHQPVACVKDAKPLKDCVISVSNYIQCEREFIESIIEILGAVLQSLLARKPKANILQSTHLVCVEPSGQKYVGAMRWGLPIVHHDWLLKCAALGIRVSEQPYLIGESKMPIPANDISARLATSSKSDSDPPKTVDVGSLSTESKQSEGVLMKSVSTTHNSYNSPVQSALSRLKNSEMSTNNSPDANRTLTPTSPYGAFYGNNPSPATRKRLWKWMQQGAEFPLDPPMNYQPESNRRESTPLSEVLSKLLRDMKRKPEENPSDSPVSSKRVSNDSKGDLMAEIPFKKLNLDAEEVRKVDEMKHSSVITTGLQKMKEIEENYTKNCTKPPTPIRKQNDSAPQMLVVTESQPHTEVGWEDPNEKEIALKKLEKAAEGELRDKIFMLTRLNEPEEVAELIQQCGGKVSTLPHFDKEATHLISMDLTRDEKLMASIAAGLWVLHPSYIEELRLVRDVHKVSEEYYEWGNPNKVERTFPLSANTRSFASCSLEWRLAIKNGSPSPFNNLKIILHLRPSKYDNFKRLIEAGGGQIVNAKAPYRIELDVDICIVDSNLTKEVDLEYLANRNIPCVTILYLSDRILKKVDAIDKNLLQPFLKYWKRRTVTK